MTDDPMMTPEYQAKVRVARRIAISVSVVVGIIFLGAGTLGFLHYKYDRPVKFLFDPSADPANQVNVERNAPPPNEAPR